MVFTFSVITSRLLNPGLYLKSVQMLKKFHQKLRFSNNRLKPIIKIYIALH